MSPRCNEFLQFGHRYIAIYYRFHPTTRQEASLAKPLTRFIHQRVVKAAKYSSPEDGEQGECEGGDVDQAFLHQVDGPDDLTLDFLLIERRHPGSGGAELSSERGTVTH